MSPLSLKHDFCLILCGMLSATAVAGVVFWLDRESAPVNAEGALLEAQRVMARFCRQEGAGCDMRLVDASPPKADGTREAAQWKFEYYSPSAGPVTIHVEDEDGQPLVTQIRSSGNSEPGH